MKKLKERSSYARDAFLAFILMFIASAIQQTFGPRTAFITDLLTIVGGVYLLISLYRVIWYKRYAEKFKK